MAGPRLSIRTATASVSITGHSTRIAATASTTSSPRPVFAYFLCCSVPFSVTGCGVQLRSAPISITIFDQPVLVGSFVDAFEEISGDVALAGIWNHGQDVGILGRLGGNLQCRGHRTAAGNAGHDAFLRCQVARDVA